MKTIKVHDETHRALKKLKERRRNRSIDQVIREMVKASTGISVDQDAVRDDKKITEYLAG